MSGRGLVQFPGAARAANTFWLLPWFDKAAVAGLFVSVKDWKESFQSHWP